MASVLVTGTSKGIGRAIVTELARRGHRVVATARDPRSLADLDVDQRLALDVTDPESVAAAAAAAGEVDVLVSNAGVIFYAAVEATPPEELARLFEQNTIGAVRVAQAVLPGMRARGHGRLLFMSSVAGRLVFPPGGAYAATKWALEALVESLAIETAPLGIGAALLEPGAVSSGALDAVAWHRLPDDPYDHLQAGGGSRDGMITPEVVASAVGDAVEADHLPLRIPIGAPATALLAARRQAPDDAPFIPGRTAASGRP